MRPLIAMLSLVAILFTTNALRAQSPLYSFASQIGSTGTERGNDIATDASGNSYITGMFTGTVDFDPGSGTANLVCSTTGNGESDIFVASYDPSGNYRWAFRLGSGGETEGLSIAVDGSANVVVSGTINGVVDFDPGAGTANRGSSGAKLTYVARYNSSGSYLWAFTLAGAGWSSVAVDGSNNIVVTGSFYGSYDFDPGSGRATLASTKVQNQYTNDIFVARYNSSGSYLWAFRVGGTGHEGANSVAVDGSGNIYLTGVFIGTVDFNPASATANLTDGGGGDIFVAKYSASGAYSWAFRAGGSGSGGEQGIGIAVDGSGNVVVTGNFTETVDFNPGTGTANLTPTGTGSSGDIFIARYSSSGGYLWAFDPAPGAGRAITIDGSGDIHVAGSFYSNSNDFDPGSGTVSLALGGFVARYTSSGGYVWAFSMPGAASVRGIAVDGNGNVDVTGNFGSSLSTTVDFDPGDATNSLTTAGGSDIFIAQYTEAPLPKRTLHEAAGSMTMRVAPNPFTSDFTFRYDGGAAGARIEIIDMMGRVVDSRDADGATEITLGAELPAGAYIVRTTQGETRRQVMVRKLR
jgi:hypothetical protein